MKKVGLLLILLISFIFNGCGANKIYNMSKSINNTKITLNIVEQEILNAGNSLGWKMKVQKEGTIIGFLTLRSHSATVRINYTKSSFKINYLQSVNLKYNSKEGTIHNNYNSWVKNLESTINNYLDDLTMNEELTKKSKESSMDKQSSPLKTSATKIIDIQKTIYSNLSIEDTSNFIIEAGKSLGWKMQLQKQGFILGRIVLRTHSATVKITYDKDSYKITYLTSTNLNYTKDYTIHKNYNSWIKNLINRIDARAHN